MIFQTTVREGYEWINAVDDEDYEKFLSFDGDSRIKEWTPVRVRRVAAEAGRIAFASDFPWLGGHALVMSEAAVKSIGSIVRPFAEILPLEDSDGKPLWVLNVLSVVNALNEEASKLVRFQSSGRIMRVVQPSFDPDVIRGLDLFRLPFRGSETYVSKKFVNAVEGAGLVGLVFHQVWPL